MRLVQPSGWRVCALFFPSSLSPFVLPSSLFCTISLSISSLAALCRSSAFDSVPVRKLLVLSTFSPFTTPFPPSAAFRSRISASLLNNCPREEPKGYAFEKPIESKNREIHCRRAVDSASTNISVAYLTHACNCICHDSCCITVCE